MNPIRVSMRPTAMLALYSLAMVTPAGSLALLVPTRAGSIPRCAGCRPCLRPQAAPKQGPFSSPRTAGRLPVMAAAKAPPRAWDAGFKRRRLAIFTFTVLAYSSYYLVRNSIYYTAPAMVAAPDLNIDITSIGVISSVFPLTYGCSKFVSGVVGDVLSPRAMLGATVLETTVGYVLRYATADRTRSLA